MPSGDRRDSRVRDVIALQEEGQRRYSRGDRAGAIEKYSAGCAIVRRMLAADASDAASVTRNATQLGSMLYTLGQWQLEAADDRGAVASLTEAEEAYGRLGEESAGLVADVVIRRALVHRAAGEPLSAIADAQQAVVTAFAWGAQGAAQGREAERMIPVARVLGVAAEVQLYIGGDPEVAVAAADWAVRAYQETFSVNGRLALPGEQVFGFRCAVRTAAVVHAAFGRAHLARPLRANALALGGGDSWPEFDDAVAHVRDFQPTLVAALHAAGQDDLVRTLAKFNEIESGALVLAPAMRCHPQIAPAIAKQLADAQTGSAVNVPEELLLGLEAHALFAEASRRQVPGLRYQFGHFGPMWAVAVMNFGQRMLDFELVLAAGDAARWLLGIVSQLQPHAMIKNSQAREVVTAALDWLAVTLEYLGDPETASAAAQVRASLN